jgi:hypothetical protein
MLIAQLAIDKIIDYMTPYAPFVMMARPAKVTIADYWTAWAGIDESKVGTVDIVSFARNSLFKYNEVTDLLSCLSQEKSFVFDKINQILYVHFEHNESIYTGTYSYGLFFGYSSKSVIYIEDIEYLPLIRNEVSISQSQDFEGYDKLKLINPTLELDNTNGDCDSLISLKIHGNTVKILNIDDKFITDDNVYIGEINPLVTTYIDDYTISQQKIRLSLKDMRTSMNVKIPRNLFTSSDYPNIDDNSKSKVIPFLWGKVREALAIPTNGKLVSQPVVYRVAQILTNIGTVWTLDNDVWTQRTPTSMDLPNGSFTLSSANSHNSSGAILKCKLIDPIGVHINYTSDIIVDIEERFRGVPFTNSNYDQDEWAKEEVSLSTGGMLLDSQVDSFEAIRQVQSGSIKGFRYEFNSDGKRTIRIDNYDRPISWEIHNFDMLESDNLEVLNDPSNTYAEIKINYNKSYYSKDYFSHINDDNMQNSISQYKQQVQGEFDTILNTESLAIERSNNDVQKYSDVRPILSGLKISGIEFFKIRIYDMANIEITKEFVDLDNNFIAGRKFYGIKKCQIIGINPVESNGINIIDALIVGDYEYDTMMITNIGDYITTNDGLNIKMHK